MSDIWYKKLGFFNNPFSIKPGLYDIDLVAYDMNYIYKKIDKGEVVFLEGEYGTGKTTILKNIITQYRGKNKIIYYSFNTESGFDLNQLLSGANTALRKLVGLRVKNVIMLLDEVHTMKQADAKKLLKPYKDGAIKSIIFVSHDFSLADFPEEYDALFKGNVIRTVDLTSKEAVALVRKRIGNIELLTDNMISKVFMVSGKNPRRLLEYCEDVCRYAIEIGDTKVTDYHVDEVLGKIIKEKQKKAKRKAPKAAAEPQAEAKPEPAPKPEVKKAAEKKPVDSKKTAPVKIEVKPIPEDGYIDIKEIPVRDKEKKFKINKLVQDDKKNILGTIMETEAPEEQDDKKKKEEEYKIYFVDE